MAASEEAGPSASAPAAAAVRPRPRGWFGIKDIFTTINAMGGVVAICLAIEGDPYKAGLAIIIGYLLGDALDGWVARKLGTSNQFGAEYDTIADHLAHCIAPGAVVYSVYRTADLGLTEWWQQQTIAIFLAGCVMVAATIRHARNIVRPIEVKGVWFGLPRTILGFIAFCYVNARVSPHLPGGWWFGVVLIPACAVWSLTYFPYPSHRMARGHFKYVIPFILAFLVTTVVALVLRPEWVFDVLLFWSMGYALTSWGAFTRAEMREYRALVKKMKAEAPT